MVNDYYGKLDTLKSSLDFCTKIRDDLDKRINELEGEIEQYVIDNKLYLSPKGLVNYDQKYINYIELILREKDGSLHKMNIAGFVYWDDKKEFEKHCHCPFDVTTHVIRDKETDELIMRIDYFNDYEKIDLVGVRSLRLAEEEENDNT